MAAQLGELPEPERHPCGHVEHHPVALGEPGTNQFELLAGRGSHDPGAALGRRPSSPGLLLGSPYRVGREHRIAHRHQRDVHAGSPQHATGRIRIGGASHDRVKQPIQMLAGRRLVRVQGIPPIRHYVAGQFNQTHLSEGDLQPVEELAVLRAGTRREVVVVLQPRLGECPEGDGERFGRGSGLPTMLDPLPLGHGEPRGRVCPGRERHRRNMPDAVNRVRGLEPAGAELGDLAEAAAPLGRGLATGVGAVLRPHLYYVVQTTQRDTSCQSSEWHRCASLLHP